MKPAGRPKRPRGGAGRLLRPFAAAAAMAVAGSSPSAGDEPTSRARRPPPVHGSAGKGWIEGRVVDPASWRKPVVAAVVGAGVAAAVVAGKGGDPPATTSITTTTTTTTSTTTTSTTSTTTTTTTTTPAMPCSYQMSPAGSPPGFPIAGGSGSCDLQAAANCPWSARSNADWVTIVAGGSGRGDGTVRFDVAPNNGSPREARIALAEDASASCRITQDGPTRVAAACTSDLRVPGGRGLVVMNGTAALSQGEGVVACGAPFTRGHSSVDAVLVAAQGRPGTWRFELSAAASGSVRVTAGQVLSVSAHGVVFRLAGVAGERCAFTFEPAPAR